MARHTYDNLVDCKTSTFSTARPSHMVHRAECCSDNGGGAFTTGVVVGTVWALWHLIPYMQGGYPATELLWQLAFTVVFRVTLVQLTIHRASATVLAVLGHASYNVAWAVLDAND